MRELVGQHEVDDGVDVGGHGEVLVVVSGEPDVDPVMVVQHARHAVKPETVKLILVQPVADVGQQVAQRLVAAVGLESHWRW